MILIIFNIFCILYQFVYRRIVIDMPYFLLEAVMLEAVMPEANIEDRDGARKVFTVMKGFFPWLKRIWADGGYTGKLLEWGQGGEISPWDWRS